MAEACVVFGFDMDFGKTFEKKYGKAVDDYAALELIIDDVMDVPLLGSAIHSRWHYFKHVADAGEAILEPNNRAWFVLALGRLARLNEGDFLTFQGEIKKIRIVSNLGGYGPMPEPDEEVEQRITVNNKGQVRFTGRTAGYNREQSRKLNFQLDSHSTDKLLTAVADYFRNDTTRIFATDIGHWTLELTNTIDETYYYDGSLCADFVHKGSDLSELVRDTLNMNELYVFDGKSYSDLIERITLDYYKVTQIHAKDMLEMTRRDYSEQLLIDRKVGVLEHTLNRGAGNKSYHKYEAENDVHRLLRRFEAEDFFNHIEGNPKDVLETPDEETYYAIKIDYKNSPHRIITGTFDKKGLPEDYPDFAERVSAFIDHSSGDVLNSSIYEQAKRRHSDYIYCSVVFSESSKEYYYLTDDESIGLGDRVLVPVGKDGHEATVQVIDIEYFAEEDVPLPIDKMKRIIRKDD